MSFENPLDLIRKRNQENAEKKEQESQQALAAQQDSQQSIDNQYTSTIGEKEVLLGKVEDFKNRIGEITGTQEEMIAQYHEAIKEAKKDPETLQYVRENFDEIFGTGKQKWREVGSEKLGTVSDQEQAESDIQDAESKLAELYPETTEGKAERERQEKEALKQRTFELEKQWYKLSPSLHITFEKLMENKYATLDEVESYLSVLQEKKDLWNNPEYLQAQDIKLLKEFQQSEDMQNLNEKKEEFTQQFLELHEKMQLLAENETLKDIVDDNIPNLEDVHVTGPSQNKNENFKKYADNIVVRIESLESEIRSLDNQIREKESQVFKIGLGALREQKAQLEAQKQALSDYYNNAWDLYRLASGFSYEMNHDHKYNTWQYGFRIGKETSNFLEQNNLKLNQFFERLNEQKELTPDEQNILTRGEELEEIRHNFEQEVKAKIKTA